MSGSVKVGGVPLAEWPRIIGIATIAAMIPEVGRLVEAEMEDEGALLRLIAICGPEGSDYTQAVLAEVERRWNVHQEHARTSGRVQVATKAQVIGSVRRDVEEGLF